MTFNWFYYIVYKAAGGEKAPQFIVPENVNDSSGLSKNKIDNLIPMLYKGYKKAETFELHYPTNDSTSILVEVVNSSGLHYDMDYLFYDQNTLQEIETNSIYGKYKNAHFADMVIRMNYDIHIGAIGGIIGKIIAFLASLLSASLPVTGILLWYGRKFKKKKYSKSVLVTT